VIQTSSWTRAWCGLFVVLALVVGFGGIAGADQTESGAGSGDIAEAGLPTTSIPWLGDSLQTALMDRQLFSTALTAPAAPVLGPLSGLDAGNAVDVVQQAFGDRIAQMTEGAQDAVAADGGVQRYLDDYTVVPRGGGRLLMSSVPLRHRDASGRSVPIDLSLVEDGNAVQPASSPVDVAIADSSEASSSSMTSA